MPRKFDKSSWHNYRIFIEQQRKKILNENIQQKSLRKLNATAMDIEELRKKFLEIWLGENGWIVQIGFNKSKVFPLYIC